MTFTWHGETLDYFNDPYNTTLLNERAVEIAVAKQFLLHQHGDGLEVGNVLGHYGVTGHRVVDLHEQAPGVENIDVLDVTGTYQWAVAISTVEHVGHDFAPRNPAAAIKAVEHLRTLAERLLITVPLGYHPALDAAIKDGRLDPFRDCVFVREGDGWSQRTRRTHRPYGASTPWAEAVWIGEW